MLTKCILFFLNEAGELIDHMMLINLRNRDESQEKMKDFMRLHTVSVTYTITVERLEETTANIFNREQNVNNNYHHWQLF